jgi:hypothetical protein
MKRSLKEGGWPWSKAPEPQVVIPEVVISEPTPTKSALSEQEIQQDQLDLAEIMKTLKVNVKATEILHRAVASSTQFMRHELIENLKGKTDEEMSEYLTENQRAWERAWGGRKSRRRRNKSRKQRKSRR